METTLNKLKEQAEINAMKRLAEQFSTSDQLEQIDQHISRSEKRKNMVESQLKSAIQSHFISVNSCMEQLKDVNKNLIGVRDTILSIQEDYKTISHLENTLGELRKEAAKHKQLKSAKENVRNILNVDDLAKQAAKYIDDNKMLLAHKCLLDMEKCRNDILEELGSPSDKSGNIGDIKLVEEFFKKLKELTKVIHNHIFVTIKRMLEVSKSYPEQLVSALRIIEREEVLDEYWVKKKEETGFIPPDRPKKWRKECKDTIKNIIETKILGLRIEERDTDESWFSKHLGNICSRLVVDLEIIKKLCEPCFPPSYTIFDFFIHTIHQILSDYIRQLLETNQLRGQEFFVVLSWQDTYKSTYFLGHPSLQLDTTKLPDILDEGMYRKALDGYLNYTMEKVAFWFQNALEKNFKEWLSNVEPFIIEEYFESSMPNDINTMLIQQLDLINYANDDRFSREILNFLLKQLSNFIDNLRGKVVEFKGLHNRNPEQIKSNFIGRMVTTSNDCIRLRDCFLTIRDKYDKFMDRDEVGGPNDAYEALGSKIIRVSDLCLESIIEDMTKCLDEQYFKILLSKEWLTNDKIITTIIETSSDYMNDLVHLKPEGQLFVLVRWHNRIKVEYMKGFMQNLSIMTRVFRKCQLNDPAERTLFSNKISKEILTLEQWFKSMTSFLTSEKNPTDFGVLTLMAKLIKAEDVDFLGVEIGALVKKCPDITSDMLFAILSLRGDISKSDYKEKYEDYITDAAEAQANDKSKSPKAAPKSDESMAMLKRELKLQ